MSQILKPVIVDCPYRNARREIILEREQIMMLGTTAPQYKTTSFRCDDLDSCTFLDEFGFCPAYRQALGY